jgi:hypothetical protein
LMVSLVIRWDSWWVTGDPWRAECGCRQELIGKAQRLRSFPAGPESPIGYPGRVASG